MDDDGRAGELRARRARGTMPNEVTGQPQSGRVAVVPVIPGAASDEPARSIGEAIERLVASVEIDEAVAEWSREGG
jgi:hypothetical protein